MTKTTNYQLPKWEKTDRIQMKDFNDMTATLDAALKANADTAAANTQTLAAQAQTIAKLGNCKVVAGSYTGDGTYGADHAITLNFSHKPMLVFVQAKERNAHYRMMLLRDSLWAFPYAADKYNQTNVTWGATSVSWYSTYSKDGQANNQLEYQYVALLAVE